MARRASRIAWLPCPAAHNEANNCMAAASRCAEASVRLPQLQPRCAAALLLVGRAGRLPYTSSASTTMQITNETECEPEH